jgi:hypothetical protein
MRKIRAFVERDHGAGRKRGDRGERAQDIVCDLMHGAIRAHLVKMSVGDHHFAVEVLERT